jgi:chromosome segregation ATPase
MRRFLDWITGKTALRAELADITSGRDYWYEQAEQHRVRNRALSAEYEKMEKRITDNSAQVGAWAKEKIHLNHTIETLERKIEEMKKQIREERKNEG